MRRIYFTAGTVTELSVPVLQLPTTLWEQAHAQVMSAPVGAVLRRFWQHQYGSEAEMSLSGTGLIELQSDIGRLLTMCDDQPELQVFLSRWSEAIVEACGQHRTMFVVAE